MFQPHSNHQFISVRGARVNNLKNVDVDIPHNKLVVITGLSGSGKSSLAFDTIYAEGQRRYVESLSSYARQFLERMNKPDFDQIDGLSPAIAIDQKSAARSPRSTVGTMAEIYDLLRLMFAKIGKPHCPHCHREVFRHTREEILKEITQKFLDHDVLVLAPLVRDQKGTHKNALSQICNSKYHGARIDGDVFSREDVCGVVLNKDDKHTIEVIIKKIRIRPLKEGKDILVDLIKLALELGNGVLVVKTDTEEVSFSVYYECKECDFKLAEIEPRIFSFNSPEGACPDCTGLGIKKEIIPDLVITNPRLTLAEGAIKPWVRLSGVSHDMNKLVELATTKNGFSVNTPLQDLTPKQKQILLYGDEKNIYDVNGKELKFIGIIGFLSRRYNENDSDYNQSEIDEYMQELVCPTCDGRRLKEASLSVTINELSIAGVSQMDLPSAKAFIAYIGKNLSAREKKIIEPIVAEITRRIDLLLEVGLEYLTLDRSSVSMSGGELQRVRLATQIGSKLTGVIYILDEPSIGLHPKDTEKLITTLFKLRDMGNTMIVVEHDRSIIEAADYIIDMGPGAGEYGGEVLAVGILNDLKKSPKSVTGKYFRDEAKMKVKDHFRPGNGRELKIVGAKEFNLKNIDVTIPLAKFVAVTGVSGSGKSTLVEDILAKALAQKFYRAKQVPGKHKEILGLENIDKVITIDQTPLGRTPRSNPATYTGIFTYIRDVFSNQQEAKLRGFDAGKFSFNVKGGRCEACSGDGMVKIEMKFLPDVYVECEACHGKRYLKEILDIHYQGKNIADVLALPIVEAKKFFRGISIIYDKLNILDEVGLGYLKLGQSATTLSGGEAQRVKLATELARRSTGKTLYILDEPTTGLHFEDVKNLLRVLNRLIEKGNTVLVIEHSLEVIRNVDWIIDLGPEGGDNGGYLVTQGTPSEVAKSGKGYTAKFL